jgi:hypothetical protein
MYELILYFIIFSSVGSVLFFWFVSIPFIVHPSVFLCFHEFNFSGSNSAFVEGIIFLTTELETSLSLNILLFVYTRNSLFSHIQRPFTWFDTIPSLYLWVCNKLDVYCQELSVTLQTQSWKTSLLHRVDNEGSKHFWNVSLYKNTGRNIPKDDHI